MDLIKPYQQRGDIALYLSLFLLMVITTAVIALNGILSSQIRSTNDIISSERALYAADTGLEQAFYRVQHQNATDALTDVDETVDYPGGEQVHYRGRYYGRQVEGVNTACVKLYGEYRGVQRILATLGGLAGDPICEEQVMQYSP